MLYFYSNQNGLEMSSAELRNTLMDYVNLADDRLLSMMIAISEKYLDTDIVAYSIDGKPLTKLDYKKSLLKAEQEFVKGDFTSQEDLEGEVENW